MGDQPDVNNEIREAAIALVLKLDKLQPFIADAFHFKAIHGMPYDGETYEKENTALRELLGLPKWKEGNK